MGAEAEEDIERLRERLAKLRQPKGGPGKAVEWAVSKDGVTEHPAGSNWGDPVEDWIKFLGYDDAVPWCGCFVGYAVIHEGGAGVIQKIRLGYGPSIIADARAGANGLKGIPFSSALPGDILVFWNGDHIGLCRGKPTASTIPTVEGNTSPLPGAGQYNGGAVEAKSRSQSDVTAVARPRYPG